jgi:hypothetical protein
MDLFLHLPFLLHLVISDDECWIYGYFVMKGWSLNQAPLCVSSHSQIEQKMTNFRCWLKFSQTVDKQRALFSSTSAFKVLGDP